MQIYIYIYIYVYMFEDSKLSFHIHGFVLVQNLRKVHSGMKESRHQYLDSCMSCYLSADECERYINFLSWFYVVYICLLSLSRHWVEMETGIWRSDGGQ